MADKEKIRFKIYTTIDNENYVFKRYGKNENDVKKYIEKDLRELFPDNHVTISLVEKDKTHPL